MLPLSFLFEEAYGRDGGRMLYARENRRARARELRASRAKRKLADQQSQQQEGASAAAANGSTDGDLPGSRLGKRQGTAGAIAAAITSSLSSLSSLSAALPRGASHNGYAPHAAGSAAAPSGESTPSRRRPRIATGSYNRLRDWSEALLEIANRGNAQPGGIPDLVAHLERELRAHVSVLRAVRPALDRRAESGWDLEDEIRRHVREPIEGLPPVELHLDVMDRSWNLVRRVCDMPDPADTFGLPMTPFQSRLCSTAEGGSC